MYLEPELRHGVGSGKRRAPPTHHQRRPLRQHIPALTPAHRQGKNGTAVSLEAAHLSSREGRSAHCHDGAHATIREHRPARESGVLTL